LGPVIQFTLLAADRAVWTVHSAVPHSGTWLGTSVEPRTFYCTAESLVEEYVTNLMSQFIKIYVISSMLNMFRTLIHPSSGACDFAIVSSHWLCVLVSMCVGVSLWLVWGGIRVEG